MNSKFMLAASTIWIFLAVPSPLSAQNPGFRVGQRQTQNPQNAQPPQNPPAAAASPNPIQGMTTPPIQGMTTSPILPLGGGFAVQPQQIIVVPPQFVGSIGTNSVNVLQAGGTIFVPSGTLVIENNPEREPGAFLSAPLDSSLQTGISGRSGRGGSTSIQRSDRTANSSETESPAKQDTTRLELGTPRDKVIEKYGNPIAFVMNMNGETLYFNGGVVVFVKNGVVASPGN
jgi:hypothetical protein